MLGLLDEQVIDLTPGSFCSIGGFTHDIGIFTTTIIENAVGGSGNDTITGNSADNTLSGGGGADTMTGGLGNDTYVVDNVGDVVIENANEGTDTVQSSISITLSANVENLSLTGVANINGTGNQLDNVIVGNAGNNVLNGGAGNDIIDGAGGDDTVVLSGPRSQYQVTNVTATSVTLINANDGTDIVSNVEHFSFSDGTVSFAELTSSTSIAGSVAINDISITEGDSGTKVLTFTVTRSGGTAAFNVNYATADGTATTADGDYVASSGTLQFADGETSKTISIVINGDTKIEVDETFNVTLSGATDGATISDDTGIGTISNDDTGTITSSVSYTLGANDVNLILTGNANIDGTGNALANSLTGNAGDNILDGGAGADTMAGGLGNDSYVVDNVGDVVIENASEGTDTVLAAISYTLGANVENLTLTGTANLNGTGNSLANSLTGNAGDNILDGQAGADTMAGGLGNDSYVVDNVGDVVIENASEGTDTVLASISYTLGANVENLTLTGTANLNGTGNSLANSLTGNAGDNILDGQAGADTMAGGLGNDSYVVDNVGDVVIENASEGTDTVLAAISYTLGANLENLTLTGTANLNGTGNSLANSLTGNAGDNILDGQAGADTMAGGLGNDSYVVDNVGDVVIENASEGTDTVLAAISYTLGANVENLTLTGTANLNGTGNSLANSLTGNAGDNILDGQAGADTMAGGLGNDSYVVDNVGDVVIENASEGTDTVLAAISYTLGANVENLTLTGTANLNGTGNALANSLTGNAGDNILDGQAGADTMAGGLGNDSYVVDNVGDVVIENASEGTDTVLASISYTLGANVENLTLTGTGNLNGTGNALANSLTGNAGDNILDGRRRRRHHGGRARQRQLRGRQCRRRGDRERQRGHRHGAGRDLLYARRQRREPDAHRHRQPQRHRQ